MYSIIIQILTLPFSISTVFASTAAGDTSGGSSVTFAGPLGNSTLTDVLNNIITYAVIISAPIATAMTIYGAFQILSSRGKPAQVTSGQNTIKYALGGLAVVIVARLLVSIVSNIISGISS